MLFTETFNKLQSYVSHPIDLLFDMAFKNQTHESDLFLVLQNGFYNYKDPDMVFDGVKMSPYTIGFDDDRLAEQTQFEFYSVYRGRQVTDKAAYLGKLVDDDDLQHGERISVQLEMMLFLKFWESDRIMKILLMLVKLANKESFDWELQINNLKDNNKKVGRSAILETILPRDSFTNCPEFSDLVTTCFNSQIRNSVAHSQFFFMGRTVSFTNFEKGKSYNNISFITFEKWEEFVHLTILFYNSLIQNTNKFYKHYCQKAEASEFGLPIRVTKSSGNNEIRWYAYDGFRWSWYVNTERANGKDN
jgi:hypothetical protein